MTKKHEPSIFPKSTLVALSNIEDRLFELVVIMDRLADSADALNERLGEIEGHMYDMAEGFNGPTGRS